MTPASLAMVPIGALMAGVLLQGLLARILAPTTKGWLAFLTCLVSLAGVVALFPAILAGQAVDLRLLQWDGPISLAYHVDGLSQLFALMAAGIGAAVLLYSVSYMAHDESATRFYVLMQLFIAGLIHLVYAADLFLVYFSWEAIGLCSFLLVGFWYSQREAAAGARKVLVMTHLAGYGLLAAVILLYLRTGSTLWTDSKVAAAFSTGIFLLMLLSAVAKSVQFPLHTWIPDAMAAPTPVSALLHAACYVKAGVYLVARMHSFGPWPVEWQTLVIWIGTITLLVGVMFAMVQTDLKRLLAFHTVSQIGYMMLGLGLGTPLGIAAGLLHCLNHGLFKGGLFLCAGAVQHATGTRNMDLLGGLVNRMPRTTALWLVVAGGISGVPLLNGFVSKWLIYDAALEAGQPLPALIAWVASLLTIFSFLKASSAAFLGADGPESAKAHEAPGPMLAGTGILAAGSVILGVAPQFAIVYLINPLLPALGATSAIQVSWMGLAVSGGSWYATGGLVLALVAVGAGFLIYRLSRPAATVAVAVAGGGVFTGGEALAGTGSLPASDFSLIFKHGLAPFYRWLDVDRYYLSLWHRLLELCHGLGRASNWLEARAVAVVLLAAALLMLARAGLPGTIVSPPVAISHPSLVAPVAASLAALLLIGLSRWRSATSMALLALAGPLAVMGLAVDQPQFRVVILEAATLAAIGLVWRTDDGRAARFPYLAAMLSSMAMTVAAVFGEGVLPVGLVAGLLMAGFVVKLALVPAYLWLPRVAEGVPAPVVGLVVAVVDVAAFAELLRLRQEMAWVFSPTEPWIALGLLSALVGAGLMLAQHDLKRMVAFSTVADMGVLLLGLSLGGELGIGGAATGAGVHALSKALLFSSLSVVETEEQPDLESRGLAGRYPVAGAGFLLGALAVLGVPPTVGYLAHWRLYAAAAQASPLLLLLLMTSTALALLAYARVVAVCWWGPGERLMKREPALPSAVLVGLMALILALGLWPGLLM